MKRYILIGFLMCIGLYSYAQGVSNVTSRQEGQNIAIYYDLKGTANVQIEASIDGEKHKLHELSGDVGNRIEEGTRKKITWRVLDEYGGTFDAENVVFTVKVSPVWRTFVVAEGAMSFAPTQFSGGVMLGRVARWGYYAKFRSSFMFAPENGSFDQTGASLNGYGSISSSELRGIMTGRKRNMDLIADVGVMYNMSHNTKYPVCLYLGGGFGMRKQMWEINNNNWVKYTPTSHLGFSGDFGLLASLKGFVIEAGVNTINFQYMEVQVGLGYMFNK